MPPQPVSADEIKAILAYVANPPVEQKADDSVAAGDVSAEEENNSAALLWLVAIILILIVFSGALFRTRILLARIEGEKDGGSYNGPETFMDGVAVFIRANRVPIAVVIIIGFFLGLLAVINSGFEVGVHTGYKPEQPIKFSHKIHAGDDKIDCNYCHSSARHGKTSGIPSLNVCMNCHKFIDGSDGKTFMYNGEEYSMTEEIQKLYTALDYDPMTQKYGDNPSPVKWVKVHNLPDHVFFSHEQHVTAGKQKCQTCHGPVEEMDVLEQHSDLTMGWCINCHRETSVSTAGNGYYDDLHSRMPDDFRHKVMSDGKITVNEIGGLECAKCHY